MGHARKERVLLIGTDQRITSGPAATTAALKGRIHSKAGYMAAPERFAETSDSFPLHRGRRPYMTLGVFHCGAQNFDAMGGTADIDWPPARIASEAYDPLRKSGGPKCCDAQRGISSSGVVGCDPRLKGST
jgi:hypothetical protein